MGLQRAIDAGLPMFWISLIACAICSYPIYKLLLLTKSRQTIDPYAPETHQKKQGTPTMGGLFFLVALIAFVIVRPREASTAVALPFESQRASIMWLFFGFAAIGFVDDFVVPKLFKKRGLGWMPKLVMQIGLATIASYTYNASILTKPSYLGIGLGVFLILFWSNAFNFADGLDGLAGSLILGLAVGFVALASNRPDLLAFNQYTFALVAATIVFLFYNAPPAKVFMGDVGSLPVGAVFGFASWVILTPDPTFFRPGSNEYPFHLLLPMALLSFVMIAELVPVPMQVAYFKLTKGKRIFPSTPIHHAFEKKGWPESRVVWTFALFQLLLSIAAISIAISR